MTKLQNLKALAEKSYGGSRKAYIASLDFEEMASPQTILKLIEVIELQQKVLDNYHHSVFHKDRILLHEANELLGEL